MDRRARVVKRLLFAILLVLVSGALVWTFQDAVLDLMERSRRVAFGPKPEDSAHGHSVRKTLYFAGAKEDLLVPYSVEVEVGEDEFHTLHNLLGALLEGPQKEGYAPILPKGTKLRAAFPGPAGIAYVDFDKTFRDAHPGGAWAELMTAYGVVSTVVKNFPDLFDRVVLLIEGQEARSVAGALAIAGPLKVREELIARVPRAGVGIAPEGGRTPAPAASPPVVGSPPAGQEPVEAVGVPDRKPAVGAVGVPGESP